MSDSFPTIQDSLSDVQKQFFGCVEMHLDPPEDHGRSYKVEALFRCEDSVAGTLPGGTIRFALSVAEENSDDLTDRRHTIEFRASPDGEPRGWIRHRMKRIEAQGGRYFWTESRVEVGAPELPDGRANQSEVEQEVSGLVERIGMLDRDRRLELIGPP